MQLHPLNPYVYTLHIRESSHLQEFAELLVKKGASASHKDSAGASVLVHAAHARMPKVVKALLAGAEGVDKDGASDEGVTALIAAAMKVSCDAFLWVNAGILCKVSPGAALIPP